MGTCISPMESRSMRVSSVLLSISSSSLCMIFSIHGHYITVLLCPCYSSRLRRSQTFRWWVAAGAARRHPPSEPASPRSGPEQRLLNHSELCQGAYCRTSHQEIEGIQGNDGGAHNDSWRSADQGDKRASGKVPQRAQTHDEQCVQAHDAPAHLRRHSRLHQSDRCRADTVLGHAKQEQREQGEPEETAHREQEQCTGPEQERDHQQRPFILEIAQRGDNQCSDDRTGAGNGKEQPQLEGADTQDLRREDWKDERRGWPEEQQRPVARKNPGQCYIASDGAKRGQNRVEQWPAPLCALFRRLFRHTHDI